MAGILETDKYARGVSDLQAWVMEALYANRIDDEFDELLGEHNLTTKRSLKKRWPILDLCSKALIRWLR